MNNNLSVNKPLRSQTLAKQIFKADVPEKVVKQLPPQSLFMALRENGLQSSSDLLEIITAKQMQVVMDFDLWNKDEFNEDNFFEWLAITDATDGLDLLHKVIASSDLKLISLLISKYVDCVTNEEPTEMPPGEGYYTPDKGHTWINIKIEDKDKEFYLNRVLALLFDTNVELFYQLLSIPKVQTESMLEEESYQDKERRLRSEGIYTFEEATEIHSGINANTLKSIVNGETDSITASEIMVIEPMIFDTGLSSTLDKLISALDDKDLALQELTKLINSAIIRFSIPFYELENVRVIGDKVKGAINLGLELALSETELDSKSIYSKVGLTRLYQRGFFEIFELRKLAFNVSEEELKEISEKDNIGFNLIAYLRETFPELPLAFNSDGSVEIDEEGKIKSGSRTIDGFQDFKSAREVLVKYLEL